MMWIMSIAFSHGNRCLQWPIHWHSASNSSLPIIHTDTKFLFQKHYFHHCTYMLKTSHYFLTYGIKVTFLNPVFKACETVYTCVLLLFLILLINYLLVSYSLDIHCSVQDSTMYSWKIALKNLSFSFLNLLIQLA